jgi:RNA polymerase sigma-70 factor (ECF subfamily)
MLPAADFLSIENLCKPAASARVPYPVEENECLLARLRRGEREAFDELARRQGPCLLRLAQRLLGYAKDDEARDAVQEVFARLIARPKSIAAAGDLEKWLVTVVVNQCRTQQRGLMRRLRLLAGWKKNIELKPSRDADVNEQVRFAIMKLAVRDREVIVLHYLEEMPVDRIGAMLKLSRNAVEVRLHRARRRMKEILEE